MTGGLFDAGETGAILDQKLFEATEERLRLALLDAQFEQRDRAAFAGHILLTGFDGAGRGMTAQRLTSWM
ncbi:MAG: polyphosphate kinase, partial [Pseudomonadota bacterium]